MSKKLLNLNEILWFYQNQLHALLAQGESAAQRINGLQVWEIDFLAEIEILRGASYRADCSTAV